MKFKRVISIIVILSLFIMLLTGCNPTKPSENKPTENKETNAAVAPDTDKVSAWEPTGTVTFIAAAGPGSGYDTSARNFAKALNDAGIVEKNIKTENISGGAGAVGFASFAANNTGKPDTLIVTSTATVTIGVANGWDVSYKDFTPLARLITDYVVLVSNYGNTELDSLEKVIEKLRADPKSLKFGGAAPPDADYIALVNMLMIAGIDVDEIEYAVYDGGGEIIPALMGGHIDIALSTGSEWTGAVEGKQLQAVAIASPERLTGLYENTPTFIESGVEMEFGSWRGMWGPKDMPEEAVKYWKDAFSKLEGTEVWTTTLNNMQWTPAIKVDGIEEWVANYQDTIIKVMEEADIL